MSKVVSKVRMTKEQLDHIQSMKRDYHLLDLMREGSWRSPENQFLNDMLSSDISTALIAPEKVEIINPEITTREAFDAFVGGSDVQFFNYYKEEWEMLTQPNSTVLFKTMGRWRKAVK